MATHRPTYTVPSPEKPAAKSSHDGQVCQKCGAMFRWKRTVEDDPNSPLTLKLVEPSRKCDCGYGKARRA